MLRYCEFFTNLLPKMRIWQFFLLRNKNLRNKVDFIMRYVHKSRTVSFFEDKKYANNTCKIKQTGYYLKQRLYFACCDFDEKSSVFRKVKQCLRHKRFLSSQIHQTLCYFLIHYINFLILFCIDFSVVAKKIHTLTFC